MVENLLALIGRFHPLIIHLPIGFIVMGLLIELNKKKFNWSNDSLKFIFFWASISGVLSIISGYFQYQKGGYLWDTVGGHFYAGITTVVLSVSFFLYLNNFKYFNLLPRKFYTLGHLIILTITGHLGGNITHGEDHLIEPINNLVGISDEQINITMNYEDYANKSVFINLIQPILDDKCVKCHNQKKTKGGLQMHNFESLVKGGKNGIILNFDDPELSEILVRIHLPKAEKKHMPPSGSKQLSREEIKLSSNDPSRPLALKINEIEIENNAKKVKKYIPLSKRQDKPDSALWLIKQHSNLKDSQIAKLVGITKNSASAIRNKSYWNFNNLSAKDPVAMGLFTQKELSDALEKAERRLKREKKEKEKSKLSS